MARVDVSSVAAELSAAVPELMRDNRIPGLAIGLCDSAGTLWSQGFGTTRADDGRAVTTNTVFSVQSCSKMYTAATVLLAVQQGLLDLDRPIVEFLPDFTVHSTFEEHPERVMTLRHLLSHTAAFTHEAPVGSNFRGDGASFTAHCRSIADTWLRFGVGHHYEYSNLGIDLAAYAVQRVSGMRFERFGQQHLLEPLGLDRTTFDQRAIAHDDDRAVGRSTETPHPPVHVPLVAAGGLYSSVEDVCRFVSAHLRNEVAGIDRELLDQLYRVPFPVPGQTQGYGLGTIIGDVDGTAVRGHSGGGYGFLCDMYWSPEHDIGVVVLTNDADHSVQWRFAADVLRHFLPSAPTTTTPLPSEHRVPAEQLRRLAGEYAGRYDVVTLAAQDDGVVLTTGGTDRPVRFTADHEFVPVDRPGERYRFVEPDADGRPRYLQTVHDGTTRYRNNVPDLPDGSPDGPWNRDHAVRVSGRRVGTARLRRDGDIAAVDEWHGRTLRLTRHTDDVWISSVGEALDLGRDPITYANVCLEPTGLSRRGPDRTA